MKKHMNKEQRKAHYDAVDNNDKIIINFRMNDSVTFFSVPFSIVLL